jgi:hypothetical protein
MMADTVGMAETTHNPDGTIASRIVIHDGWRTVQVPAGNGEWWNVRTERVTG